MHKGISLTQLSEELTRQKETRLDYLADTRAITAVPHKVYQEISNLEASCDMTEEEKGFFVPSGVALNLNEKGVFPTTDITNGQLSKKLQIPKKYFDRMLEGEETNQELLCTNINHWLQTQPEKRMVRTLDGNARAYLSERYRPLDNYDLAEAVLPTLLEKQVDIVSCNITEARMYIKAINYKVQGEVGVGDTVASGVIISNSEVGKGRLYVGPFAARLACKNGMVINDWGKRKYHVGKSNAEGGMSADEAYRLYTDKTKEMTDQVFWHQVRDLVTASLSEDGFGEIVSSLKESTTKQIQEQNPFEVMEVVEKKWGTLTGRGSRSIRSEEKQGILQHLIHAKGDTALGMTQWGLANAITRQAEDVENYDRATELESLGYQVATLDNKRFDALVGNQ